MNKSGRKRWLCSLLAGLCAMTVMLQGCSLAPEEEELLAPPIDDSGEVTYTTETIKRGDITNKVSGTGSVNSQTQYNLAFTHQGGYLKTVNVKLGQQVSAGEVLAELDTDSIKNDLRKKELEVEKLQMQLENLQNSSANLELERKNLRLAYLQSQYDASGQTDADLKYQIDDLKLEIQQLQQSGDNSYEIQMAQKDLEITQIDLENLQLALSKGQIVAPSAGTVTYIEEIAIGDYIAANKTLITLADPSNLILEYSGGYSDDLQLGMAATITMGGNTYTGKVATTPADFPAEQQETHKETVYFQVDGLPADTAIGTSAQFEVVLEEKKDVLLIPKSAVLQYMGSYYARTLSEDGIRAETAIEVGVESGNQYEVVSGLNEGDTIILE